MNQLVKTIIICITITGCSSLQMKREMKSTRDLEIMDVDFSELDNGTYKGAYTYCDFKYEVEVYVTNKKIDSINVLSNRSTKKAKQAENIIARILKEQSLNVDAQTGATTTSKAILKATENALTK
ncbi:MAG: FMN-binding protein [Marinilabiliales bacterium]|nr:MAG: FMN-binding protein [Marinilabiliales bacterium]